MSPILAPGAVSAMCGKCRRSPTANTPAIRAARARRALPQFPLRRSGTPQLKCRLYGYRANDGAYAASRQRNAVSQAYATQQVAYASRSRRGRNAPVPASTAFGSSNVVSEARRYLGGNPTGRSRAWCAAFMNMVLQRTGHSGSGSNLARSFASYGQRVSGPQIGAIAVMSRRGGGHVGVVSGIDASGNPIVISGNHGRRVAELVYLRGRIYAYVMPM